MKINKNLKINKTANLISKIKKARPESLSKEHQIELTNKIMDKINTKTEKRTILSIFTKPKYILASTFSAAIISIMILQINKPIPIEDFLKSSNFLSKDFRIVMENMDGLADYKTIKDLQIILENIE